MKQTSCITYVCCCLICIFSPPLLLQSL